MEKEIRKNTKDYHNCDICKRMFANIKNHLKRTHRNPENNRAPPLPYDSIEIWKAYYSYTRPTQEKVLCKKYTTILNDKE